MAKRSLSNIPPSENLSPQLPVELPSFEEAFGSTGILASMEVGGFNHHFNPNSPMSMVSQFYSRSGEFCPPTVSGGNTTTLPPLRDLVSPLCPMFEPLHREEGVSITTGQENQPPTDNIMGTSTYSPLHNSDTSTPFNVDDNTINQ